MACWCYGAAGKTRNGTAFACVDFRVKNGVDMNVIRELLSYGELKGLLQWRNGGYGRFVYEEIIE